MPQISTSELARLTGTSKATVMQRCKELERHAGPNRSVCYESTQALPLILGLGDERPHIARDRELARLNKHRADLAEMESETRRGNLVPIDALIQIVGSIVAVVRTRLMAMPVRIAGELPVKVAIRKKAETALTDNVNALLHELADELEGTPIDGVRDVAATATDHGKPVGRKRKVSKRGSKRGKRKVAKRKSPAHRRAHGGDESA